MATLPTKRSPMSPAEGSTSPKKSKAEKKRESISRAQQWAAERKRKKEGVEDDSKKHKVNGEEFEDVVAKGEERDALEDLPSPRSTRSRRSNRSDEMSKASEISEGSVASRRSTRRLTMNSKASASVASASTSRRSKSKEATPRKSRKSLPPPTAEPFVKKEDVKKEQEKEEDEKQEDEKKEPADEDVQIVPEPEVKEEGEPTTQNIQTNVEETIGDTQTDDIVGSTGIRSYIPSFVVFLYTIFLQWTIAFAAVLVFFLDWFVFEFHPNSSDADYSNQRASCAILGFWLVTVAGYFVFLGAQNLAGWILATASLSMASFVVKTNWGAREQHDIALPSLPIYSISYVHINVLDALVLVAFAGWFILSLAPSSQQRDDVIDNESPDAVIANEQVETIRKEPEVKREEAGPRSFIRNRVAVEKSGVTYHGTVVDYDPDTRMWRVKYDAGEGLEDDELNRLNLASAFRLYAKDLGDSLKAMWRANEI
ncbi:hypothetical protein ACHAWX_004661 [Stephanocyclus meneghinianus]